jgi:formylglycine-generating enzyme required for sulfatase activity
MPIARVPREWLRYEAGLIEIGAPEEGFAFDNERPRHRVFVEPFELASHSRSRAAK